MRKKATREKIFPKIRYKRAPIWTYFLLWCVGIYCKIRFGLRYNRDQIKAVKKIKGPIVILSTHPSPMDTVTTANAILSKRPSMLSSRMLYYYRVYRLMIKALKNTIPKKQYLTDIECIRHIKKMIDAKVSVLIFPEGRESIDGNFQGFTDALGKLIKWLRVPVVSIHSPGCFLTRPRWLPGFRIGRIETEVKILLNADEVDTLTAEEINSRVRAAIDYNDFDWQARNKVEFKSKEFKRAESLFRILYKCPACGAEYKNISDGDELRCTECGNRVVVGPYGEMTALDGGVSLPRIDKWYRYQQDMLLEEIKRKGQDYSISTEVKRAEYDWDKLKFVYKESGVLTLTLVGFEFVGDTRKIQFVRPNNPPAIHSDLYFEKIILFLEDDPHEFTCTGYERPAKFNQVVQAMSSAFPTELRKKQPQST